LRLCGRRFAGPDDDAAVTLAPSKLVGGHLLRNSVGAMAQRLKGRGPTGVGRLGVTMLAPAALRAFVEEG